MVAGARGAGRVGAALGALALRTGVAARAGAALVAVRAWGAERSIVKSREVAVLADDEALVIARLVAGDVDPRSRANSFRVRVFFAAGRARSAGLAAVRRVRRDELRRCVLFGGCPVVARRLVEPPF